MAYAEEKFKLALFYFGAWLVSAYLAYGELHFRARAVRGEGEFVRKVEEISQLDPDRPQWISVEFRYWDGAASAKGRDSVYDTEWDPPAEGRLAIQFIPGVEGSARLADNGPTWAIYVFAACSTVAAGFVTWLFLMARAAVSDKPRSRRRR